jgi:hypothetical protein
MDISYTTAVVARQIGRAKWATVVIAVMSGLLFLEGQLGPVSFQLRRLAAGVVLVSVAIAVSGFRERGLATILAFCGAVGLVVQAPTVLVALLGYVLAVAFLGAASAAATGGLTNGLTQALLFYVGVRCVPDLFPQSRVLSEALSNAAHRYLLAIAGTERHFSATAMGAPAVLMAAIFLVWRWRISGSWTRLVGAIIVPFTWFFSLALALDQASGGPTATFIRGGCYGVFWLACAALIDSAVPQTADNERSGARGIRGPLLISVCVASFLVAVTLVGVVSPGNPAKRAILVHNQGGLDWDRPVFGRFGIFSGGMFGLLPVYAQANGYRFKTLDRDSIMAEDLSGFQTLVLINSPKMWKGEELRTVRDFVARGSGLLILGDHTDVFGLMTGFNSLLAEFGILYQFDSAYHARPTWRGCLSAAPDAVAAGWDVETPGVAIGASLKLSGSSRPLLNARYSHSDHGVRSNVIGSFLGNYTYEDSEQLGDQTLIATATHGLGRVIVLGDTSPFQGNFGYSFPRTVGPLLALLARPTNVLDRPFARAVAAVLLIAVLLICWMNRWEGRSAAAIAGSLLMGVAVAWIASRATLQSPIKVDSDCFLIDKSHRPAVGHHEAKVNPSGPLSANLERCGLRVVDVDEWDRTAIAKAKGIAFIAPQRSFTKAEVDDLLRFEEAGGVVLLAVGEPDSAASRPLFLAHGLDLANRPLGTVPSTGVNPGRRAREKPRFLDAWPIVSTSSEDLATVPGVDVLYRAGDDVVALFRRHGRGGLLFFSDTRYFSSMNIEDMSGNWVGNLALIHDAFRKYLDVNPDAVHPVFSSPKKPE